MPDLTTLRHIEAELSRLQLKAGGSLLWRDLYRLRQEVRAEIQKGTQCHTEPTETKNTSPESARNGSVTDSESASNASIPYQSVSERDGSGRRITPPSGVTPHAFVRTAPTPTVRSDSGRLIDSAEILQGELREREADFYAEEACGCHSCCVSGRMVTS